MNEMLYPEEVRQRGLARAVVMMANKERHFCEGCQQTTTQTVVAENRYARALKCDDCGRIEYR